MDEACASNVGVKAVSAAESEYQKENKEVKFQKPLHTIRDSPLSTSINYHTFKGFLYLLPIILIFTNISIGLEHIAKYGLLLHFDKFFEVYVVELFKIPPILTFASLGLFCLFSFGLEILLLKGALNENLGLAFIILSLTSEILTPPFAVHFTDSSCVAVTIVLFYLIVFFKLTSYHVENYSFRRRMITADKSDINNVTLNKNKERAGIRDEDTDMVQYPDNLNIKNFCYFFLSPTICYELNFPRRPNIRKKFLFMRLLELLFLTPIAMAMLLQICIPLALDYEVLSKDMGFLDHVVISMKYCVSTTCFALAYHYIVFHSILNILGEITRFGDRSFYKDWWNAGNMREFWGSWNLLIHRWSVRYLFIPVLNRGFSKFQATFTVFLVSGFLHEYLCSIPIKVLKFRMFFLMIGQIPVVLLASKQSTNRTGSIVIWVFIHVMGIVVSDYFVPVPTPMTL